MLELTAQVALRLYPWVCSVGTSLPQLNDGDWCAQAPGLLIPSTRTDLSHDPEHSMEMWCFGSALICFDSA